MLKIYICPECYNFRMVSKKNNAVCLHCSESLKVCTISYDDYSNLDELERGKLKERLKVKILSEAGLV